MHRDSAPFQNSALAAEKADVFRAVSGDDAILLENAVEQGGIVISEIACVIC
jgi:hypothetical protein